MCVFLHSSESKKLNVTVAYRNFIGLVLDSESDGYKHGREAAFMRYLASALHWNIQWVPSVDGNWGSRLPNGSFDGMIGMLQRKVKFINHVIYKVQLQILN